MKSRKRLLLLALLAIFGTTTVTVLFLMSETIVHHHNKFIRRFPLHVAQETHRTDLGFNSYYFAGSFGNKIYLGNSTAPLLITVIDTALHTKSTFKVNPDNKALPFRHPQISVFKDNFYMYEGSVPYIFKGATSDWNAKLRFHSGNYFSQLVVMDSVNVAVRFIKERTGESIIGSINLSDTTRIVKAPALLQKQLDGIFDTDGYLSFDPQFKRLVYLYRYRNEYTVANTALQLDFRGNTIDTVSQARVKLAKVKSHQFSTFAEPPLIVNNTGAVNGGRLFVHSALPGKYDSDRLWKTTSIIDVYDLTDRTYQSSFPVYHIGKDRMRSFIVVRKKLFALIGDHIVSYRLLDHLTEKGKAKKKKDI